MSVKSRRINEEESVSPVIATILMVAITVVLAGTLYVWAANLAESNTDGSLNLYTFESKQAPVNPTDASTDSLAILTMTQGQQTSWSVITVKLSINGAASTSCAVPGQTSGSCILVDSSEDATSWTVGEDVTVVENGVDLCSDLNCEMTFTITNIRTGQSLAKTSTGTGDAPSSGDYTPPTPPTGGDNGDSTDSNDGSDNNGDSGDDSGDGSDNSNGNDNPNACDADSECMAGGYCMNGMCVYDDQDRDGIANSQDNCPQNANANQADSDNDGVGDACDATPFGPMTTYYLDADGDTYGDATQTVDAYTQPANYVTNSDDCDDSDATLNVLNSNGNCAPEPQPSVVEALTQTSVVNSIMQNGHKYVFNGGTTYDENTQYGLGDGTYQFSNIAIEHPMAILNAGKVAEISYTPDNNPIVIKVSGGSFSAPYYDFTDSNGNNIDIYNGGFGFMRGQTYVFEANGIASNHPFRVYSDGSYSQSISGSSSTITVTIPVDHSTATGDLFYDCAVHSAMKGNMQILNAAVDGSDYDFFYGDITVTVTGDFGVVSVYCLYHGYMGGQDLLVYGSEYEIADTTAPVITVLGNNPVTIEVGSTYTDAGATADGGELVTSSGTVDTNTVGVYTITYSASDSSGNQATATRTVNVVDTNAPVITIIGDNPATVEVGSTYTDAGATTDSGEAVTSSGTVDTNTLGVYTITYTATDSSGNQATATRTVNVVDTTIPVMTLIGSSTVTIEAGSTYTDAGASALDNYDGDITSSIVVVDNVDTSALGSYTVIYNVADSSGNNAIPLIRGVDVVDTTAPIITINGASTVSIQVGSTYTDLGATATDNLDGDLTASITVNNNVDANTVGTYTVTYDVTDTAGNQAIQVTRTVNVDSAPNNAPSVDSVTLSTSDSNGLVYSDVTLTCTSTTSDADGDTVTTSTTWTADGTQIGTGSSITLTTSLVDIGDAVYCTVTPNDGTVDGTPVDSTTATVVNYAPTISSVTIDNTSPTVGDTLTCSATASDPEGHTLTTTYTWYVNTAEQTPTSPTFDTTGLSDNDAIYCSASVTDAYGATTSQQSSSVTVSAASGPTTHYIDIQNMDYSPSSITINVGDTIIWTNQESSMPHTVTANDGSFNSGNMGSGDTFSFTFTSAGTFDYYCAYHSSMTGTVTVQQ